MDITSLVISSAVAGAAGSFIKELSSNGVKWLIELATGQSKEMQTAAKANMENFVMLLAKRVERLENEMPADKTEFFNDSLNHPSSALLIKTAIVDAATTENEEKHELLAELIAQRLTANADDLIALTGAAACSIVNSLSSRQIKILAVLSTIKVLRPLKKAAVPDSTKAKEYIIKWWATNLEPLLKDTNFNNVKPLDFEHLAAMGCIRISVSSSILIELICKDIVEHESKFSESDFISENWYKTLKLHWGELGTATPLSIGQLIGILHRDSKLKTSTQINW